MGGAILALNLKSYWRHLVVTFVNATLKEFMYMLVSHLCMEKHYGEDLQIYSSMKRLKQLRVWNIDMDGAILRCS